MKFSQTHEWVDQNNEIATVGITNYGRMHLGDIVNIKLPEVNKEVTKDQEVCIIESNKAAVDVHSPISGTIIEINQTLSENISILNSSPEKDGWIFKVKMKNPKELDALMDLKKYEKKVSK